MPPQSGRFSGPSPAAVMSHDGAPSPATTITSPRASSTARTNSRRSSVPGMRYSFPNALAPITRCPISVAVGASRVEGEADGGVGGRRHLLRPVGAAHHRAHRLQHRLRRLSHRHLRRVELAPVAPHRHQHRQRRAVQRRQREHVDAVAHARTLHQQHALGAAQPRAAQHRHALLLRGERDHAHRVVAQAPPDQPRMAGIGDQRDLADAMLFSRS